MISEISLNTSWEGTAGSVEYAPSRSKSILSRKFSHPPYRFPTVLPIYVSRCWPLSKLMFFLFHPLFGWSNFHVFNLEIPSLVVKFNFSIPKSRRKQLSLMWKKNNANRPRPQGQTSWTKHQFCPVLLVKSHRKSPFTTWRSSSFVASTDICACDTCWESLETGDFRNQNLAIYGDITCFHPFKIKDSTSFQLAKQGIFGGRLHKQLPKFYKTTFHTR